MSHVVAQLLEAFLGIRPRIGLAGHEANHKALLRGEIDLYIEYTGTALRRLLRLPGQHRGEVFDVVRDAARRRWPVEWLPPFGFNNTYALLGREYVEGLRVRTCTDLVPHARSLTLGAVRAVLDSEPDLRFAPGGVDGLRRAYGLAFGTHREVPPVYGRTYRALADGEVDVIVDFPVHPTVHERDLVELIDERAFFGAYHAAPVVRREFLDAHPDARQLIERLAGRLDNRGVARLNFLVDVERRSPADVAAAWLREAGLVEAAR